MKKIKKYFSIFIFYFQIFKSFNQKFFSETLPQFYDVLKFSYPFIVVLFIVLVGWQKIIAGGASGGQPGQFLSWGAGARSLAMGKAFLAVSDDSTASYWNPAGLAYLDRKEVSALHAILFFDTSYDFLAYAHPHQNFGTFAFNITRLISTGFTVDRAYFNPQTYEIRWVTIDTFNPTQTAYTFAWGKQILEHLASGVSVKFLSNILYKHSYHNLTTDVGIIAKEFVPKIPKYKFAFIIRNLFALKFGDTDDKLPLTFRIGNSYTFLRDKLTLALDIDKNIRSNFKLHTGAEYWVIPMLALRLGLEKEIGLTRKTKEGAFPEPSAGFGVKYKDFIFDYALANMDMGISHRFSGSWRFGPSIFQTRLKQLETLFQESMEYIRTGSYLIALTKLNQAIEIDPTNKKVKDAIEKLQKVTSDIPTATAEIEEMMLVRKGVQSFIEGDKTAAVNFLKYAFNKNPRNDQILSLLNKLEKETAQPLTEKPREVIKGFTLIDQKIFDARQAMYQGKYDLAIKKCQEIIDVEPNNITALELMGSAFFLINDKERAKALWQRALELDPTNKVVMEFLKQIK